MKTMADQKKELKNIAIITGGSRGDIQPYIAVALALEKAGHSVTILTNEDHVQFCEKFGIRVYAMFSNVREMIQSDPRVLKSMAEGDTAGFLKMLGDITEEKAGLILGRFLDFLQANRKAPENSKIQLMMCGSLSEYYATYAWFFYDIPFIHVHTLVPIYTSKKHACFGFPTLPFGLHYYLLTGLIVPSLYKTTQMADVKAKELAAARTEDDILSGQIGVSDIMSKSAFFEEVVKPVFPCVLLQPSFWKTQVYGEETIPSTLKFVGPAVLDLSSKKQVSEDAIDKFLQADPTRKPVYCGWGSMVCKSPSHMVKLVVSALHQSQQRGIVLGGFANLSTEVLVEACKDEDMHLVDYARENILFVQEVNHEKLFTQVSCTIHHGGQGTLAAALRSGVPTIVTPVFLDQYDSAHLVETMGNGIGFKNTRLQKLSASQLADAITKVVSSSDADSYKQKAKEMREEMMRDVNDGSSNVVTEVQKFWKDIILSGRMDAEKSRLFSQSGYQVVDGNIELVKAKKPIRFTSSRVLLAAGAGLLSVGMAYSLSK